MGLPIVSSGLDTGKWKELQRVEISKEKAARVRESNCNRFNVIQPMGVRREAGAACFSCVLMVSRELIAFKPLGG